MELETGRIYGNQIDPLIVEQVLKQRMLADYLGCPGWWGFDHRQQPHGFVIVGSAVIYGLKRQPGLKIALASRNDANAGYDIVNYFTPAPPEPGIDSRRSNAPC